jgi:uncharacterized protein YcaQ
VTAPTVISRAHARRFLVARHLLAPPRSLEADPASVLAVVARHGLLQFDPIAVPGARSHELVLHARIAGYQRGWLERWLYGPDRRLIELYNKSLNILPLEELACYRIAWDRTAPRMEAGILREQAELTAEILERIAADGPVSSAAFAHRTHTVDWWWAPTRASRAVLEALFISGRIGIADRDGDRRSFDLIERLVPPGRLAERVPEAVAHRHRFLSEFRASGLASPSDGSLAEATPRHGPIAERRRLTAELVETGALLPVEVDGLRGTRYVVAEDAPTLTRSGDPNAVDGDGGPWSAGVSFIAPLDPLAWDRRLLRELWDFDYLWEIYVPEAKRRWGYYVLPVLYGDRLVGRIEPRYERRERALRILRVSLEDPTLLDDPDFIAALGEAVEAYRRFVGAKRVTWPRGRPDRDVAAALRRLG